MSDVWAIMRAVRGSNLPHTDRHIILTLVSLADPATGVIPDRYMPSLTDLAEMTGLGRSTVARRVPLIVEAGWVAKSSPSKEGAWRNKETNSYTLLIPVSASPRAGLVPERDQQQAEVGPRAGPVLVPERDRTSPAAGHEVPDPVTNTNHNPSSSATPPKPKKPKPPRDDVERLCTYLAEWIIKNGSRKPTITQKWRTEARLMIDKDGRDVEEIKTVIRWSQRDTFWKANILSMPKLREKYDQLRLRMEQENTTQGRLNGGMRPNSPRRLHNSHENQDRYDVKL